MMNAFIFYKTFIGGSSHTHKAFILEIVYEILSTYNWKKDLPNTEVDVRNFYITKSNNQQRRCSNCWNEKDKLRTMATLSCKLCYKGICKQDVYDHFIKMHVK